MSRHDHGQSLVEVAIAMPMLLILLLGVLDVGRMYFTWLALQNAAAEAALYAAIDPNCIWPDDGPRCTTHNNVYNRNAYDRAKLESSGPGQPGLIRWERIERDDVVVDFPLLREGQPITITLYYDYDVLTPIISPFLTNGKLRIRARASQVILNVDGY